ncbi:MAG: hypothetical protein MUQ56_14750 [Thermoleophilia bacterium]|nr:hypothetical protein [Thermoleophilia bacterium]
MECPVCGDRLRSAGTTSRDTEKTSREDEDYGDRQTQPKKKKKGGLLGGLMDSIGGGGED